MKNINIKIRTELISHLYRFFNKTMRRKMNIDLYEKIYHELQEKTFDQISRPIFHEIRSNIKL